MAASLSFAFFSVSTFACNASIHTLHIKCDTDCKPAQSNDQPTIAMAIKAAIDNDVCVGTSIDVARKNTHPGGFTVRTRYYNVASIPVTSIANLTDFGSDFESETTYYPPAPSNSAWFSNGFLNPGGIPVWICTSLYIPGTCY
jgi:hypothetical protein